MKHVLFSHGGADEAIRRTSGDRRPGRARESAGRPRSAWRRTGRASSALTSTWRGRGDRGHHPRRFGRSQRRPLRRLGRRRRHRAGRWRGEGLGQARRRRERRRHRRLQAHDRVTLEDWNRMIAINLTGQFLVCQAALPHILASKGAIINTASVAGLKSHPYSAAYCASKGGVVLLTKALAAEYGRKGSPHQLRLPRRHRDADDRVSSSSPTGSTRPCSRGSCPSAASGRRRRWRRPSRSSPPTTRCTSTAPTIVVDGGMIA